MEEKNEPLERYEERFIQRLRQMSGRPVDTPPSPELESLIGDSGEIAKQDGIYVNPGIVENYALTQREADRRNTEAGVKLWYGCSCGRLHQADPKTGKVDTGWY